MFLCTRQNSLPYDFRLSEPWSLYKRVRQSMRIARTCACTLRRPFVSDGWNLFDVLVVALSLVALGPVAMPINVLR